MRGILFMHFTIIHAVPRLGKIVLLEKRGGNEFQDERATMQWLALSIRYVCRGKMAIFIVIMVKCLAEFKELSITL